MRDFTRGAGESVRRPALPGRSVGSSVHVGELSPIGRAAIQEVWTDGDSLFVLLDRGRCIVYEYVLPDATGVMEALSFVDDPGTVGRVRKDLEQDRDARRIP
jgi:hypothetical protein